MHDYVEGLIRFSFPDNFAVIRYDEKKIKNNKGSGFFYCRQNFYEFAGGTKAVDFIALDTSEDGALWLIEVKDCIGSSENTVSQYLREDIPQKVRDTFAGLIAGALTSDLEKERDFMNEALNKRPIRVVAHIELPDLTKDSKIAKSPKALLKDYSDMAIKNISKAVGRENVFLDNTSISHKEVPWKTSRRNSRT